jgi:hypothetical protein
MGSLKWKRKLKFIIPCPRGIMYLRFRNKITIILIIGDRPIFKCKQHLISVIKDKIGFNRPILRGLYWLYKVKIFLYTVFFIAFLHKIMLWVRILYFIWSKSGIFFQIFFLIFIFRQIGGFFKFGYIFLLK